jgi:hypothetical protein
MAVPVHCAYSSCQSSIISLYTLYLPQRLSIKLFDHAFLYAFVVFLPIRQGAKVPGYNPEASAADEAFPGP